MWHLGLDFSSYCCVDGSSPAMLHENDEIHDNYHMIITFVIYHFVLDLLFYKFCFVHAGDMELLIHIKHITCVMTLRALIFMGLLYTYCIHLTTSSSL